MPVTREGLARCRRLLELAHAQKAAVLSGQFGRLEEIVAERQALLHELDGAVGGGQEAWYGQGSTVGLAEAGAEEQAEARDILEELMDIDRQCQRLVAEKLQSLDCDLAVTRRALRSSQAYRRTLVTGQGARLFDERK